ncbi:Far upstream element-binding protein 1-like protein [Drosera capensis]
MSDDLHYSSATKRKYEETSPPPQPPSSLSSGRRSTGFSAPILPPPSSNLSPPSSGYNNNSISAVNEIEIAKQRAQAIAARLFSDAEAKRPKHENGGGGGGGFDASPYPLAEPKPPVVSNYNAGSDGGSYVGYQSTSKKIDIPNNRVGVIIGKGGETIKYLQTQSGAKIQVTRDMDADLHAPSRTVELMGTPDQIANAEQLISEVLAEAEAGRSGTVSQRMPGQGGSDQFVMQVANNKVGLVIGKGGETIKSIQARTGARVQVIPLHLPPGDTSTERTVQINGSPEQVEAAKQLVMEVTSENRGRGSSMGGGYSQQGYQARSAPSWAPGPPAQQPGYGYGQPNAYSGPTSQYSTSQPNYAGYPQQTGAYPTSWDPSGQSGLQASQGAPYGYYNQQPSQPPSSTGAPADNTGYNYSQYPAAAYGQQGYSQDAYGSGGYSAPGTQAGYGQPPTNPQHGYDQQQAYNSAATYGNPPNQTQDGQNASYGTQGETGQGQATQPSQTTQGQQGYSTGQQPSSGYPSQGSDQLGYVMPPTSQPGYGTQQSAQGAYGAGYGLPPPAQKAPTNPPSYGQPQQSPSQGGGYGQPAPAPPAYSHPQPPPTQSGYVQTDAGTQRTPTAYGTAGQPGAYPSPYGAPPGPPPAYAQQPPPYGSSYGAAYGQSAAYPSDGSTTPVTSQAAAAQPGGAAKTSPES